MGTVPEKSVKYSKQILFLKSYFAQRHLISIRYCLNESKPLRYIDSALSKSMVTPLKIGRLIVNVWTCQKTSIWLMKTTKSINYIMINRTINHAILLFIIWWTGVAFLLRRALGIVSNKRQMIMSTNMWERHMTQKKPTLKCQTEQYSETYGLILCYGCGYHTETFSKQKSRRRKCEERLELRNTVVGNFEIMRIGILWRRNCHLG